MGASVLALMMTLTPYKLPPGFKTTPNSVEVILKICDSDGRPITGATVTLRSSDEREILARTRLSDASFRFYQAGGRYRLSVEMPGFQRDVRELNLQEESPTQLISVTLQRSSTPLFIQRVFR
jgi:HSP20 family molecular chaperone IbpA